MASEFRQATLDGAGMAMWELRKTGNPAESQVAMALMGAYVCSQYGIDPHTFAHTLANNILAVAQDDKLMPRTIERIHQLSSHGLDEVPQVIEEIGTSHKVGDLLRHGIHPRTGVKH